MSEFNVFKLNDIITTHDDTPVITGLTQIYLSQVTTVYRRYVLQVVYLNGQPFLQTVKPV